MSQASSGDTVRIHYKGTLEDGTEFDSSEGREPLEFELGTGQVINGFDQAVQGMGVGDKKSVRIEPDDAYGTHHEQLVQSVPASALPEELTPTVGMQVQGQAEDGQVTHFTVTAMDAESVTLDANHPLAGQTLLFDIELVEIV